LDVWSVFRVFISLPHYYPSFPFLLFRKYVVVPHTTISVEEVLVFLLPSIWFCLLFVSTGLGLLIDSNQFLGLATKESPISLLAQS